MKLPYPKMVKAPMIHKESCNYFKMWQCDWKHSNTHAMMSFFFFFFGKICTIVKNKMNGEYLITFYNKKIRFPKKIENHVATLSYGFVW